MVAIGHNLPPDDRFGGLEQFTARGAVGDVGYCIAGATPYTLEFSNDADVICLLLGDIVCRARFDDDRRKPLVFLGQTAAYHPRGGCVQVKAEEVRQGFVAFSYSAEYQASFDDAPMERPRLGGSRNNIRKDTIRSLASFVLARLRTGDPFSPFEIQSLASLLYLETIRAMGVAAGERGRGLSDREFRAVCEFVDAALGADLTCAQIAAAANVPLRAIFDGMKRRTGMTPYRFVIERRMARARDMLLATRAPISDIALACGFSSQQHMTSLFSGRLGKTPRQFRAQG